MNIPKLRFPEFKDEWKKRTLKELTKINQGLQIPIKDRFTSKQENSFFYITNEFLKEDSKVKFYIKNPPKNVRCTSKDILMTRTGNTGIVITGVEGAFHNNFFKVDYNEEFLHKYFLYLFLTNTTTQNLILRYAAGSTILDLNHNDFYKIPITFPTLPEQTKIANFLSEIDKRIKLLTDKVSKLEEYKKGAMQKLFSQEVRFKDEKGEAFTQWENKSFKQIASFLKGRGITIKETKQYGRTPCIRYGELYTLYHEIINQTYSYTDLPLESLIFSKSNDVIIPSSGETNIDIATAACVIKDNIALGGDLNIIRLKKDNGVFIAYYLNNYKNKEIASLAQGNAVVHLYNTHLKNLILSLPSLPEQTKIANFLSSLDTKIKLTTKELDKTEEYKKGILQQMFI